MSTFLELRKHYLVDNILSAIEAKKHFEDEGNIEDLVIE